MMGTGDGGGQPVRCLRRAPQAIPAQTPAGASRLQLQRAGHQRHKPGWKRWSATASRSTAVFNLAARAGVRASVENPWVYIETNMTGTLNLLELCRKHGIPKFILASTSSIYGSDAPLPTPETARSDRPLQPYAASKKGAEALCHAYHFLYGIGCDRLPLFHRLRPGRAPGHGHVPLRPVDQRGPPGVPQRRRQQSRGFTYVDDIARGTILGLKPARLRADQPGRAREPSP